MLCRTKKRTQEQYQNLNLLVMPTAPIGITLVELNKLVIVTLIPMMKCALGKTTLNIMTTVRPICRLASLTSVTYDSEID